MAVERTLVLIKPDAVQRGLAGEILSRLHLSFGVRKAMRVCDDHWNLRHKADGFSKTRLT